MKQCPQCRNTYSDDNLFCLEDGTALEFFQPYESRSFSGDMPTAVIPSSSHSLEQPTAARQKQPNWLYPVVGILAALVIILGFLLFYKFNSNERQPENSAVAAAKENANRQTPTPAAPAPAGTPAPPSNAAPSNAAPFKTPAPVPVYLPAQSRVRFGKGKISANVTGLVPPGASRSLVLACRPGQYLSASVSSPGGCVSFANGSANIEGSTTAGDNFLYIKNNCGGDGSFNMNIFIK
jgi:hypothetical protein